MVEFTAGVVRKVCGPLSLAVPGAAAAAVAAAAAAAAG
jgi:hypothetical protein